MSGESGKSGCLAKLASRRGTYLKRERLIHTGNYSAQLPTEAEPSAIMAGIRDLDTFGIVCVDNRVRSSSLAEVSVG